MLKRLYVDNFRCLVNFELLLASFSSVLLVGKNGAGKSTVGRALRILQRLARGTNRISDLINAEDFSHERREIPMRLEIEASIMGRELAYSLAMELPTGFKELRVSEESLSCDGILLYSRVQAQVTLFRSASNSEAKFLVDWHLVALPLIQEQSTSDPLHLFKNWLGRMLILAPLPSQINGYSEGDSLFPNIEVTNFGEWFAGLLAHSPAAYGKVDSFIRKVMPDFKDIKNPIIGKDTRSLIVQFFQNNTTLSIPFGMLSDGEKCYFVCALLLAAYDAYGPLFCFWDEPDNYLTLSEVGHLAMDLRRVFESSGQIMMTSHNPEAIRQFSRDHIILLSRKSHLEPTRARTVSEISIQGDLIDAIIRDDL